MKRENQEQHAELAAIEAAQVKEIEKKLSQQRIPCQSESQVILSGEEGLDKTRTCRGAIAEKEVGGHA